MKKTVTALMVILPLLFLIALFAITSASVVSAAIPASGISITNKGDDGVFSFDIANYASPLYESDLGVEVLPYKAKNRNFSLSITDANTGEATDIVSKNEDGSFALNDVGVAKLTYTSDDGGYADSVIFNVASSGVISYSPVIKDASGEKIALTDKGNNVYSATLSVGSFVLGGEYYPQTVTNIRPKYAVTNENAVKLNSVSGKTSAYFETNTTLTMSVVNAFGDVDVKTIELSVENPYAVSVNGNEGATISADAHTLRAPLNTKSFTLYVDAKSTLAENITLSSGITTCSYSVKKLTDVGDSAYAIDVTLDDAVTEEKSVLWSVSIGESTKYFFKVAFSQYDFAVNSFGNLDGKADLVALENKETEFTVSCEPDENLTYDWSVDDTTIAVIDEQNADVCTLSALKSGKTTLRINWNKLDGDTVVASGVITRTLIVTKPYTSLMFKESITTYGLGALAIANRRYDGSGNAVEANYKAKLYNSVLNGDKAVEEINSFDDLIFRSDNESLASVIAKPTGIEFIVKGNGLVTISASWKYGERFNVKPATITFNAVDGVYVSDYAGLMRASDNGEQIVLENDVYLGENLFDENGKAKYNDATMRSKLLSSTKEMDTTFDSQYYYNVYGDNAKSMAKLRYCYEFNANAYGNGHVINAEYITHMFDSTGNLRDYAVFRGPLNFVAASVGGVDVASVKGQDNVCFLIRKKGITLDNVVLAGCNDESLYNDDRIELNLLNNTGTTLELMNDATIKNCRIKNGRTVVRAHGKYGIDLNGAVNVEQEKIYVTIDGCRLQNAREFILKTGTNRIKRGKLVGDNPETTSPSFYDGNGNEYTAYNSSACDDYINDEYFVNNHVLTDVTLKDSTLSTSGLFAIGMESHFSGVMLDGGSSFNLNGWTGLAGTSYPAVLHMVGDVVLDNWKDLSSVDSSTLIETNINSSQQNLAFLSLDVGEMISAVKALSGYEHILYNYNDTTYVHGGIAFYGGGKNYSVLDTRHCTSEQMQQYNINIGVLKNAETSDPQKTEKLKRQGELLPLAAGTQDFRFVMFDGTSESKPKN